MAARWQPDSAPPERGFDVDVVLRARLVVRRVALGAAPGLGLLLAHLRGGMGVCGMGHGCVCV